VGDAGGHTGGCGGGFLAHLDSSWGYDEPKIIRYSNRHFAPIGAGAGQLCVVKQFETDGRSG